MKVNYNNDGPKRASKRTKKKKRRIGKMIYVYFTVILIGVLLTLSYTVWFEVTDINVKGGSVYGEDEVLISSGVYIGDNLMRLSADEVSKRIEKNLPYVKKAKVTRDFPHTVIIKITDNEEFVAFKHEGKYYIADSKYKILKVTDNKTEGLPVINGNVIGHKEPGDTVSFTDKQQVSAISSIFALKADGINVTYISIKNTVEDSDYSTFDVCIDGRLYVKLGDSNNLDRKLTHLETMIGNISESGTALISLEDWSVTNKRAVLKYEDISSYIDD